MCSSWGNPVFVLIFFLNINLGTFLSDLHFFFPSSFCVLWDFFFWFKLGCACTKGELPKAYLSILVGNFVLLPLTNYSILFLIIYIFLQLGTSFFFEEIQLGTLKILELL